MKGVPAQIYHQITYYHVAFHVCDKAVVKPTIYVTIMLSSFCFQNNSKILTFPAGFFPECLYFKITALDFWYPQCWGTMSS